MLSIEAIKDLIIYLAAIAVLVVFVVELLKYLGVPIPRIVYVAAGCIFGIVLLVWLSRI